MHIGILGGTFDPIHFGHIRPAVEVKAALGLDEIWLMPNHIPPHKRTTTTSTQDRLAMVKLVCDELDGFRVCDIEATRESPSYTVTTLTALHSIYPEHHFAFMMGMDSFVSLPSWYQWQRLLDLADIIVSHRPSFAWPTDGIMADILQTRLAPASAIRQASCGRVFSVDISPQDYSSTQVRQQLLQRQQVENALPSTVMTYIQQHGLYLPE